MSRQQRLAYAAIAVVIALVAVVLYLVSGDDDESEQAATPTATATATATGTSEPDEASPAATPAEEPAPKPATIRVRGGKVTGGPQELEFDKGETVRLAVSSDVADHVHVHGYDLKKDVAAGGTARFRFEATISGIFEVELEESGVQLASLRVNQ